MGSLRVNNISGAKWFISFVDDHTRVTWLFLVKEKSETKSFVQNFHKMIQTQFQAKLQILRSDNAKEYFNSILGEYFRESGIVQQSSCIDTLQQNGVDEQKNRHLLEVARSVLFSMNVPKQYWGEAILTATYLINRMPSRVLQFKIPCQVLLSVFPHTRLISSIPPKIFGSPAFVRIESQNRSKLDPKALKCIFIGYPATQKGYKCYCPSTRKFYASMDVTFFEKQPYYPNPTFRGRMVQSYKNAGSGTNPNPPNSRLFSPYQRTFLPLYPTKSIPTKPFILPQQIVHPIQHSVQLTH